MKTAQNLLLITLAIVVVINVIEFITCYRTNTIMDYSQFTLIYSILAVAFASLKSGKKEKVSAESV